MKRVSTVTIREKAESKQVKIGSDKKPILLKDTIEKWQTIIDTVAKVSHVKAGLIMKLNEDTIEVFIKSNTKGNPYKAGEKAELKYGLFCETVIGTKNKLIVPNALKSDVWKHNNPDVDINMISYIGFPIYWPDGEVFGTICLLDDKENNFNKEIEKLLIQSKKIIESELKVLTLNDVLEEKNKKLQLLNKKIAKKAAIIDAYKDSLKKEERKEVFHHLPIAICTSDKTRLTFMNKKFKKLTGYSLEETPNWRAWFGKVFPDKNYRRTAFSNFLNDIKKYQENPNKNITRVYKITAKNGKKKCVEVSFNFLKETFVGSFIDITKNLKDKKKLKENQERFKSIFEQTKAIILIINPKTRYIEGANAAALNFYGYTKKQLLEKKITEINQLSDEEVQKEMDFAVKKERTYFEFKHQLADGTIKDVNVYTSTFSDAGVKKIQSIIIDVTQDNLNKLAIIESEKRFKTMFEKVNIVKLIINPKTQFIEQANLAAEKYYGYSLEQLKKMKVSQINTLDEKTIQKLLNEDLKNKQGYHEFTHKLANGEIRNVQAFTTIITIDNEEKAYVSYYDNTKEKIATQQLKESITTKDKFFSIITHDIRAPFNNILGFSSILTDQIREGNYENVAEFTEIIEKSSQNAMNLLENLMEWARMQSNKMTFYPEFIDLSKSINNTLELLKYLAKQKNITIEKKLPKKAMIYADEHMIDALLRNLISNAIKFTNLNGKIKITLKLKSKTFFISIEDNGVGMSTELVNNLFIIGKNISSAGTQQEIGTGLGLVLSKEFVDKHQGKIYAESKLGKGTTFYVELPQTNPNNT